MHGKQYSRSQASHHRVCSDDPTLATVPLAGQRDALSKSLCIEDVRSRPDASSGIRAALPRVGHQDDAPYAHRLRGKRVLPSGSVLDATAKVNGQLGPRWVRPTSLPISRRRRVGRRSTAASCYSALLLLDGLSSHRTPVIRTPMIAGERSMKHALPMLTPVALLSAQ